MNQRRISRSLFSAIILLAPGGCDNSGVTIETRAVTDARDAPAAEREAAKLLSIGGGVPIEYDSDPYIANHLCAYSLQSFEETFSSSGVLTREDVEKLKKIRKSYFDRANSISRRLGKDEKSFKLDAKDIRMRYPDINQTGVAINCLKNYDPRKP